MSDLIAWLRAQLDDDERVARAAADGPARATWTYIEDDRALPYVVSTHPGADRRMVAHPEELEYGPHIARHDPARVLADIAAKRAILDGHALDTHWCPMGDALLLALAQPYAGRDGWREEWRA